MVGATDVSSMNLMCIQVLHVMTLLVIDVKSVSESGHAMTLKPEAPTKVLPSITTLSEPIWS